MTNIRKNWRSLFAAPLVLLLAAVPAPVSAQTTADQVKDRESLKAFVLDAKRYIESITDYNELMGIRATLQERRKWVSGETYLMLAQANGSVPFHAGDRSAESKNILAMRDDRGVEVVRKMIDVADNGGGFVDYVDGELKTSYAVKLLTGVGNITFYLIGGYSQDLSSAPPATVDLPKPAVTAAE
ncbi:MAG: cache domain-containing protein, partial [Chloroflexi bacterium]|nr:cache domain-containing protein [Chloroflexota bacterium]